MTRYQLLRSIGFGWFTAGVIAGLNKLTGVQDGLIKFIMLEIEYDVMASTKGN